MGCSASKPNTHFDKNPEDPSSSSLDSTFSSYSSPPVTRALSLPTPLVHHPPLRKGDTNHLVSLTSTTYGSLLLIDKKRSSFNGEDSPNRPQSSPPHIAVHTPKTLVATDQGDLLSPDSVINTWELMDGLDDLDSDSGKPNSSIYEPKIEFSSKSSSSPYMGFDGSAKKVFDSFLSLKSEEIMVENPSSVSKPLWKHLSEESLLSKLDSNVVSSYRRALSARQLGINHSKAARSLGSSPFSYSFSDTRFRLPGTGHKIVLYFTSLRGIRKTYEDCCSVRTIFKGFRVPVDERDISMDSMYKKELEKALLGKAISLPQVFIRGRYIGGAEEIKQLNETGELAKLLEDFPVQDPKFVCDSCGDARFVPCPNCSGSRKIFEEEEDRIRRCPDCNENGLIRCPGCCS